uniref:Signal peptide-containing protein n=1 Tax=Panagrellus redivivus TaxID=6233 RepID=A0A7E4WC35_PANRE
MNIQILPLLSAVFITVSGAATKPKLRETFYDEVDHLALSLDPRDYIVPLANGQSNLYHDADVNMITEMTIFYYAETVADKHVMLSLTCSEQRDYEVKFEIHRNGVFLLELDERGQYNLNNAVIIKHPLTHFKIESDDKRALTRIFIKGFFFDVKNSVVYNADIQNYFEPSNTFKETWIKVPKEFLAESVCSIWYLSTDQITIKMIPYTMFGSKPREDITLKAPRSIVQIRILSLRFAILVILHDIETKERFAYELFIADKLPTAPVKLQVFNKDETEVFSLNCRDEK